MRKSTSFRGRPWPLVVAVLVAVLAQLHLLFVVEIHDHKADSIPRAMPVQVPRIQPQPQASQPPGGQFCAACQIARQGSVWPASNRPTAFQLPQCQRACQTDTLRTFLAPQLRVLGRAPPLFS